MLSTANLPAHCAEGQENQFDQAPQFQRFTIAILAINPMGRRNNAGDNRRVSLVV